MLTKDQAAAVFEKIRKFSSGDEVEALFYGGKNALTRFANNTIHQNVAEENYGVSVRTVFGGRTARASTNKLDDESLRKVVQASENLACVQTADPDLLPVPDSREARGPGEVFDTEGAEAAGKSARSTEDRRPASGFRRSQSAGEPNKRNGLTDKDERSKESAAGGKNARSTQAEPIPRRYFEQTAAVTPEQRADAVAKIVAAANRHQLTAAGMFATSESVEGIFNSRGLSDWHSQTSADISVTMLAADSSGWQKSNSPNVSDLDAAQLAETAAGKARESAGPWEIAAGKYTVILEPAAVLDIVGFMFFDYGGLAILDQRSFLNNRVGTPLFGKNINIWDDFAHPLQSGAPFDGEGMRRQRVRLVENGTIKQLVYARASAEKMKHSEYRDKVGPIAPTGHGFPVPNEMGEAPMNIVFEAPNDPRTIEQMIASTERGVLVTRLWYIREVDPYEKILTGMTRDGTFYIENGKIQYGVRNFRFNESLIHMLSNVEEMGTPVRASGEESFDMVVPAMKVREFNFTEVTKF